MKLLVTAFGPFGGRELNASSLALAGLRKAFPGLRTRVLPVDAVIAPSRLIQAIRLIQPDALIMLGEAGGSTGIRLETTAWNELDFRIPDIAGRKYSSRPILRDGPASLPSTLPLTEIRDRLVSLGHPVTFSHDPGRYLCNLLFFRALHDLAQSGINIPAGFIHLPLESDFPTERVVAALSEALAGVAADCIRHAQTEPNQAGRMQSAATYLSHPAIRNAAQQSPDTAMSADAGRATSRR